MKVGLPIWHCKRIYKPNAVIKEYELPNKIVTRFRHLTLQPASGDSDIEEFGENIRQYQNIIAQPYDKWVGVFVEGDMCYVEKTPTEEDLEDTTAENADYIVDSVRPQNKAIRIILKKRTGEN